MRPLYYSFALFVRQIWKDSMLITACMAAVLSAFFFRFGIPALETALCAYLQKGAILLDYYLLFDLFLAFVTPYMFCFASAMMMLTEYDENMANYLAVTPVGKMGYIVSRLVFPAIIAFLVSLGFLRLFSLTPWNFFMALSACALTALMSIAVALLLFSYSHNRVEGMAMAKLSGLLLLGLMVPFFLSSNAQYLFSLLPSFWIAKYILEQDALLLIPALVSTLIFLWALYRKFIRKIA